MKLILGVILSLYIFSTTQAEAKACSKSNIATSWMIFVKGTNLPEEVSLDVIDILYKLHKTKRYSDLTCKLGSGKSPRTTPSINIGPDGQVFIDTYNWFGFMYPKTNKFVPFKGGFIYRIISDKGSIVKLLIHDFTWPVSRPRKPSKPVGIPA